MNHNDYFELVDDNENHKIIFFTNRGAPTISLCSIDYVIIERDAVELDKVVGKISDTGLRTLLEWIIRIEWTEGCVIVEKEIAKRGLHSESSGDRFEL